MTENEKTLFEATISKVKNSASSIFSKNDVLDLLITLASDIDDSPAVFTKEHIINSVKELLQQYSWDEFVGCEPELHGSYADSYSLDISATFNEQEFTRDFIYELGDYFTPNNQ